MVDRRYGKPLGIHCSKGGMRLAATSIFSSIVRIKRFRKDVDIGITDPQPIGTNDMWVCWVTL